MNQNELDQEVARATGESLDTISAMGFSVLTLTPPWVVVDHRVRLGDLTRQQMRRRLKARENSARMPKTPKAPTSKAPTRKTGSAGSVGGVGGGMGLTHRRTAARAPEWSDLITPMPRITTLTFDPWGA